MGYIKARLAERSTRLGLITIAGSVAVLFFPQYAQIINAITAAAGGAYAVTQG